MSAAISEGDLLDLDHPCLLDELATIDLAHNSIGLGYLVRYFTFAAKQFLEELLHSFFVKSSLHEI
jgi:hypothetical protein